MWDRDNVAFYGDPAWQAIMAAQPKAFSQRLSIIGDRYTFTITPNNGADSFKPINQNGSQRGWRPIVHWLPHRIEDIQVIEAADLDPVVKDNFILIPNPRSVDPARKYQITFTATNL